MLPYSSFTALYCSLTALTHLLFFFLSCQMTESPYNEKKKTNKKNKQTNKKKHVHSYNLTVIV